MTKRGIAFMNMVYALLNFFIKYADKISKDTIVQNTINKLTELTDKVKYFRAIQKRDTRGITIQKSEKKLALSKSVLLVSSIERTFAFDTKNHELFKAVDDSKSTLTRMSDTVLLRYADTVLDYAAKYSEELKAYDLTADMTDRLNADIKSYSLWMTKPREAQSEKVTATKEISSNLGSLRELITGNLDNAMFKYEETDKPFYEEYISIREIMDPMTRRKDVIITVLNEETRLAEPNVAVTVIRFKAGTDLTSTVKLTNKDGLAKFRFSPGHYQARFEKFGFDPLEKEFFVNVNEITQVEVAIRVTE